MLFVNVVLQLFLSLLLCLCLYIVCCLFNLRRHLQQERRQYRRQHCTDGNLMNNRFLNLVLMLRKKRPYLILLDPVARSNKLHVTGGRHFLFPADHFSAPSPTSSDTFVRIAPNRSVVKLRQDKHGMLFNA